MTFFLYTRLPQHIFGDSDDFVTLELAVNGSPARLVFCGAPAEMESVVRVLMVPTIGFFYKNR